MNQQKIVYDNNLVKCVCGELIGNRTRPSRYTIIHFFRFSIVEIKDHSVCPIDYEISYPTNFFSEFANSIRQRNVLPPMEYEEISDSEFEPPSPDVIVLEQSPEHPLTPGTPEYSPYYDLDYSSNFASSVLSDFSYDPHAELREFLNFNNQPSSTTNENDVDFNVVPSPFIALSLNDLVSP